ncbi:hypothetical protein [Roseomonas haemaphysalidis]|uniref:Uncharacterized protein n=1 Tax=Roseomonas haemaphysalidis TaxID=2768162 RepID=A0ABS3KNK4_9PROT|nr:hypothetical protein [Roseomonas haemaphysalidis]MBO1079044.1 hypothetical protein [Roseomonas haemaphysalidis]
MRRAGVALLLLASLAACATPPPPATLPPAASRLDADPVRAAIRGAADAFAYPESLAGRPEAAAIAVAQLEFLAVEVMANRTSLRLSGIVGPALQAARVEVRDYLGIAPGAAPQAVIDALLATPPDLSRPTLFTAGPAETLRRLSAMPRLPQANTGTAIARQQMEFGPPELEGFRLR